MKQLNITILLTMLMSMVGLNAFAHDIEVKNGDGKTIYYNFINNTELAVTYRGSYYYDSYSGNVVIPESVTYDNKTYSVTSIGSYAFCQCSGLTSVTIPNSVTSIQDCSFLWCTSLKSVKIPDTVTSIGKDAFGACTSLTSLAIPESVTSVGEKAFLNAAWYDNKPSGLVYAGKVAYAYKGTMPNNTSIEIKEGTTEIVTNAFLDCKGLTSISIPSSVKNVGVDAFKNTTWYQNQPDGLIYAGKVAYKYKGTMPENTSLEIKDGTLSITDEAFSGCTGLTSIDIPTGVTNIGYRVFKGCHDLTSVSIPNSVTSIGEGAFCNCGFTSITIPNSVKEIGNYAFDGCSYLEAIDIPESVTTIGKGAFSGCSNLKDVSLPNRITSISDNLFSSCSWLVSITIPESVTSIGSGAFASTRLVSIDIPNSVTSIGSSAFANCSILKTVTIPNSVTKIPSSMFLSCNRLTSVTIPNSVTSIGENAFMYCFSLQSVTIPESVTNIGKSAFSGCTELVDVYNAATTPQTLEYGNDPEFNYTSSTLHVPVDAKALYQAAYYWKKFSNIVEDANTVIVEDDKEPATTVEGEEFYNLVLDKETVNYAEIISANEAGKGRIAIKDGGLLIIKGDNVRFALSEIKKGDILVFDFVGKIRCLYGTLTANTTQQNSFQQVTSDEMELESGKEYIANEDCDVVLEMETTESPVELKSITITEPTGVSIVENSTSNPSSCKTYNLAGQQVNANSNGLLIQDGKKVIK